MEPLTVVAIDNSTGQHATRSSHSVLSGYPGDSNTKPIFLTTVKYVFQDDEYNNNNDLELIGERYQNIVFVELDQENQVESVNMVSDKFHLLSYTVEDNDIELQVLSEFPAEPQGSSELDLDELISTYQSRNKQLQSLINDL